jgi:hypothetical protein
MVERHMPELPLLDRAKIQAEVLIPLLHAFEDELGAQRARQVFGEALREHFQSLASEQWVACAADFAVDNAVEPLHLERVWARRAAPWRDGLVGS